MRAATRLLAVATCLAAAPLAAQTPGPVRRVAPKAFPLSVTPSAGLGFGATRATYLDTLQCASDNCWTAGAGSGWTAGLDFQAPLGRTLGVEVGGQVGRPSQKLCFRSQCQSPTNLWAIRGSALLLWRFKPRAPIYFGFGGAVTHFDPAPVVGQNVTADGQAGTTEFGGVAVVGFDFRLSGELGGRVIWRSYLMIPSSDGLPGVYEASGLAWDNALSFGVRLLLGS